VLELPLDFGSGEVAAEGGVVDLVVVGELAERFAGGPASNQRRVGNEPARSRLGREWGLWQLERVVGEGLGEDGRVDQVDGLFQGAQLVGVEHGLGAPTGGDDTLSDLVERVVLVGTGGRQPRCVMLVQHGLVLVARRTPTRPVLSPGELEGVQLLPLKAFLLLLHSAATDADVRSEPHTEQLVDSGIYGRRDSDGNDLGGAIYDTKVVGSRTIETRRRLDERDVLYYVVPDLRSVVRRLSLSGRVPKFTAE
jgi:hypothetical protein